METTPDYVPLSGTYIWKYRKRKSSGLMFNLITNGGILGMVFLALVCMIVMVFLTYIEGYIGRQNSMWIQTGAIFAMTGLILAGALYIGRKGNSMQLSFGRNEEGDLYVFDYRSQPFQSYLRYIGSGNVSAGQSTSFFLNTLQTGSQIERIDEERILERIMESGYIVPYGRKVISVKKIEQKKSYCQIYCSLYNASGTIDDTRLIISRTYEHLDELLHQFQKIQWNSAFDRKRSVSIYEKYRPLIRVLDIVLPILCIACLAGCVISRVYSENITYEYQKVEAQVISCEGGASMFSPNAKPTVTVYYEGKEYRLHNVVQGSWFYHMGQYVESYLADGKMFANIEGVKSIGISGNVYFIFLFSLMFLLTAFATEKAVKKDIAMKSGEI